MEPRRCAVCRTQSNYLENYRDRWEYEHKILVSAPYVSRIDPQDVNIKFNMLFSLFNKFNFLSLL